MAQLKVLVRLPETLKDTEVQLPDDQPVKRLLPILAEKLGVKEQAGGATVLKLSYKAPNPPDPFSFNDDDTLKAKGVKEGSTLLFTHEFKAGE